MIHPTALIHPNAVVGEGCSVGPWCSIGEGVRIGAGTTIASHVCIQGVTTIGAQNRIHSYVTLGSEPQSIRYKGEQTRLSIGERNTIREYVLINTGTPEGGGETIIQDDNYLMAYSHIAHDCRVGSGNILANGATLAGHVEVGNFVNIGGLTPVHQFVRIGDLAMIGGASAVSQDIPPFCLAQGNHARVLGINRVGLRRRMGRGVIDALHHAFLRLLRGSPKECAQALLQEQPTPEVRQFAEFILQSKRGIPYSRGTHEHTEL